MSDVDGAQSPQDDEGPPLELGACERSAPSHAPPFRTCQEILPALYEGEITIEAPEYSVSDKWGYIFRANISPAHGLFRDRFVCWTHDGTAVSFHIESQILSA
ncbi:MAG: hypothetical protein NVV62_18985 [Terricaulis sp.]|nr:hypothetical protein [Terricaulis sp.]